jgi:hypothetical protein
MTINQIIDAGMRLLGLLLAWPPVVLAAIVILRKQLTSLCSALGEKVSKLEIGGFGIEFTPAKARKTIFGLTNFSAKPVRFDEDSFTFRSRPWGFEISYPARSDAWRISLENEIPDSQKQMGAKLFLFANIQAFREIVDGVPQSFTARANDALAQFTPNVGILVQRFARKTIGEYMALSWRGLRGAKIFSHVEDAETNSAFLEYQMPLQLKNEKGEVVRDMVLHSVQRAILREDAGYVVLATATTLQGVTLPPKLNEGLGKILNSFAAPRPGKTQE